LVGADEILTKGKARFLMEVAPWGDLERDCKPSAIFKIFMKYGYTFKIVSSHWLFYKAKYSILAKIKCSIENLVKHFQIKTLAT